MVDVVLEDLKHYWARAKVANETAKTQDRTQLTVAHNTHADHVRIRLLFIRFLAKISTVFQISTEQLDAIYDLLAKNSIVESDQDEFMLWCKRTCDKQTADNVMLNLEEVGKFFAKKMEDGDMQVAGLSEIGFELLQSYFISSNEQANKIKRLEEKKQTNNQRYVASAGVISYSFNNTKKKENTDVQFEVQVSPFELDHSDIAWKLALECNKPAVVPRAMDFLIRVYSCLNEEQ